MSEEAGRFFKEVVFWVFACSVLATFLGWIWGDLTVQIVATCFALAALVAGAILARHEA